MSYQGERARPLASETGRYFEVSKVRIGPDGHVSDVLWAEVDAALDRRVGARVAATAAEVVDAIHDGAEVSAIFPSLDRLPDRPFVVVEHSDGRECIAFEGAPSPGRNIADLELIEGPAASATSAGLAPARVKTQARGGVDKHAPAPAKTFAVSKVRLDEAGRITAVLWGAVDTRQNAWANAEVEVPVAAAVDALRSGDRVYALFSSDHGHLADRQFVIADYDGSRRTIVLDGPSAYEREVHDMARLA
jgi:hypothetical protein